VESELWPPPPEAGDDSEPVALSAEAEAWEARPAAERLADVLAHLRRRHCYCLFCGCQVWLGGFGAQGRDEVMLLHKLHNKQWMQLLRNQTHCS
jgi:Domain of unknown function (DUF4187)